MTKVQLHYELHRPLTDADEKAIRDVHSTYGMQRVQLSPTLNKLNVEYDASRLTEQDVESYRRAADFLNLRNVDIACLQHEYGIFGGAAGSHILDLMRALRMPVVTTLHTVLKDPTADQRRTLEQTCELSARVVVMTGNVVLKKGKDVMRGAQLTINLNTNQATLGGGAKAPGTVGGRVQGVFTPNSQTQ